MSTPGIDTSDCTHMKNIGPTLRVYDPYVGWRHVEPGPPNKGMTTEVPFEGMTGDIKTKTPEEKPLTFLDEPQSSDEYENDQKYVELEEKYKRLLDISRRLVIYSIKNGATGNRTIYEIISQLAEELV